MRTGLNLFSFSSKKSNINSDSYIKKLPLCMIGYIQSFLGLKEQMKTCVLSSSFRNSFFSLLQSDKRKECMKYIQFLMQLEQDSGPNLAHFINTFMSINIISLPPHQCGPISLEYQAKILNWFLAYRYAATKNKHFWIDIYDIDNYNLYYHVLGQLSFKNDLKITLNIDKGLLDKLNDLIPLFTIITPRRLSLEMKPIYAIIQDEILKKR